MSRSKSLNSALTISSCCENGSRVAGADIHLVGDDRRGHVRLAEVVEQAQAGFENTLAGAALRFLSIAGLSDVLSLPARIAYGASGAPLSASASDPGPQRNLERPFGGSLRNAFFMCQQASLVVTEYREVERDAVALEDRRQFMATPIEVLARALVGVFAQLLPAAS